MAPGPSTLLTPDLLARLEGLKLRARTLAEGILTGLHRSPHHGQSIEFAEHKEYAPGDEVRHIDWKAWGKTDKVYVKRFEQETNLRSWLVLDASGSMGWKGPGSALPKHEYASTIAAALAYLLVRQQDAVGLVAVSDRVVRALAPRAAASHFTAVAEALEALAPAGPTRLAAAVDHVVEAATRRSQVVVLSDLMDPDGEALARLAQLRRRRHEVTIFHVLDPAELEFPWEDPTLFLAVEDARSLEVHAREVRRGYLEVLGRWLAEVRRRAAEADLDYVLCRTDRPPAEVLVPFLARRERHAA